MNMIRKSLLGVASTKGIPQESITIAELMFPVGGFLASQER